MDYLFYNIRHNINFFTPKYILTETNDIINDISNEINKLCEKLEDGSLVFISGLPFILGNVTENLSNDLNFKYWIACEFKPESNEDDFPLTHYGLLFLQKQTTKKIKSFNLDTLNFRVPHKKCPSCNNLTKDWGGKKHTMNPKGTAFSDVWYIGDKLKKDNSTHNDKILNIIKNLVEYPEKIILKNSEVVYDDRSVELLHNKENNSKIDFFEYDNKVINKDCVSFIDTIKVNFPNGIFDVAFSDPPYNLNKKYSKYEDNLKIKEYLEWCEKWLYSKYESLKPGGSLFVMNIPKWSIHHFNYLKKIMIFDKWIVWDALSTPAGKLQPAHYSILHFVKPGDLKKINKNSELIPSDNYCLRNSCIRKRNEVELIEVTDIWKDCHRVKHNKNKNDHPCQLPIKLLDRIINKYSFLNGRIFDPFGGTGSAAVASKINYRNFTITDIDKKYCEISEKNLLKVKEDNLGKRKYILEEKVKQVKEPLEKEKINNKNIELDYIDLCKKNNKILSLDEIKIINEKLFEDFSEYNKKFSKLQSLTKRLYLNHLNIK